MLFHNLDTLTLFLFIEIVRAEVVILHSFYLFSSIPKSFNLIPPVTTSFTTSIILHSFYLFKSFNLIPPVTTSIHLHSFYLFKSFNLIPPVTTSFTTSILLHSFYLFKSFNLIPQSFSIYCWGVLLATI